MALPIRTTLEDVQEVCTYLSKKPTGATMKEARAVLDAKHLDVRKLSGLRVWGLVEGDEKMKLTARGREVVRDHSARQGAALAEVVRSIEPYEAIIERAAHRRELSLTALEVAAHWHEHFSGEVSDNEKTLNEQAVCFFQLASGAELGELVIGRRGSPTRFEFDLDAAAAFVDGSATTGSASRDTEAPAVPEPEGEASARGSDQDARRTLGQAIFIAHGKNKNPLEQLERILGQFKVPYKVAIEEPNLGRPIGEKVRETMQACNCAILIFTADEEFVDKDGNTIWRPSENVVYELGASGYLYGNRLVILKEDGVDFPVNFRDIGHISFGKDQLEAKSMDLLKELIGFGILKVST
jgi:predicted nucleotide-binding protein